MNKKYDHTKIEKEVYEIWEKAGVFSPERACDLRRKANLKVKDKTFSVLMPPPNANAPLHCGHATYSIQDVMARVKRMQGYQTLYLPGTDHAGFETQVVYERNLKTKGKTRFDYDRETFYNSILDFVKQNSDIAINQLKKLGMSADWNRNTFMLDDFVVNTVYDTFIKMHSDGLIYRDMYMVNYSPHHGTTFSNLETVHKETISPLYFVKYKIKDSEKHITVATVRPETIYADVAIAVNPKDKRYKNLVSRKAVNPLTNKELPIIQDSYVDIEFGTGALKITPGHDFNDYEIGKKHNLETISIIDLEGNMTKEAAEVTGLNIKDARKKTIKILESKGAIKKVNKKYKHNLLVDYKDELPIEPMLLPNWFVKMENLAKKAMKAVENEEIKFNRNLWKNEMLRWLKNIHDWPISRQIVFGIKIPIWYSIEENPDLFVVFLDKKGKTHEGKIQNLLKESGVDLNTIKKGLQKLIAPMDAKYKVSIKSPGQKYIQETDTFDTWFSSGQWPLTTLKYPDGEDFNKFFPTSFMDSMWDILFFWIARMIMFSLYLTEKVPFKQVYIHGRITDEKGQKMSKSKGNVIDPLDFIQRYGADALRMGILVGGNTAAKNTALSEDKVRGYRNFANKIWNIGRFMMLMFDTHEKEIPFYNEDLTDELKESDKEILNDLNNLISCVNKSFDKFRFADAGNAIYQFMWHKLADEYVEQVKNRDDLDIALSVLRHVYINSLKLLHPFMPFVTEALWKEIPKKSNILLAVSKWPE